MSGPLQSLMECGTRLWLDSIDPQLVRENRGWGVTGATSNPVIVSGLVNSGRFDDAMQALFADYGDDEVAWRLTDQLVQQAQDVFADVWQQTNGNDGYVSFELDPLIEDPEVNLPHDERVSRYIELGVQWARGHQNRMIKVPATPAGIDALEELTARGVTLNVTLIFTADQYRAARDSVWRGAQRRESLDGFKSVYSIFVSRLDVYTAQDVPQLSGEVQGQVGILNAKRIWQENQAFWQQHATPLEQEIVFASTGVKDPAEDPCKYVLAFAGSDIQTNPPDTNQAVADSGLTVTRQIDVMPSDDVQAEIDAQVDFGRLHAVLMEQGIQKFADPQKKLLESIRDKRAALTT